MKIFQLSMQSDTLFFSRY